MDSSEPSFWERHNFAIRRLHSLSGLVPVGGYMVIHLLVNASVLNSPASFQANVANIHKFGSALPILEWSLIFIPILFHAIVGMVIVAGGLPNTHSYPYGANYRYTLQRITGVIAFFFIGIHVFHMHGWFHNQWWVDYVLGPLGGGQFKPYNATSTASEALQSLTMTGIYLVGVLSCVFHLANGLWTMGITWGVWTSPHAQRRALGVCTVFGLALTVVSVGALFGMRNAVNGKGGVEALRDRENKIIDLRVRSGDLVPNPHKQWRPPEPAAEASSQTVDAAQSSASK